LSRHSSDEAGRSGKEKRTTARPLAATKASPRAFDEGTAGLVAEVAENAEKRKEKRSIIFIIIFSVLSDPQRPQRLTHCANKFARRAQKFMVSSAEVRSEEMGFLLCTSSFCTANHNLLRTARRSCLGG
jgi:hypothetical protein